MSLAKSRLHLGNFDTLRLILAMLVVFSHSFALGTGSNRNEPLSVLTGGRVNLGEMGVWSFFVISGFLITQSWTRSPAPIKYLRRRVARIYPGFIVAALFGALVVLPLAADPRTHPSVSLLDFLRSTLCLMDLSYVPIFSTNAFPNAINGSLWSISFEFGCYIAVMLLGLAGAFRRRWLVVSLFSAIIAVRILLSITGLHWDGSALLGLLLEPDRWFIILPFFLAGAIFHLYGGPVLFKRKFLVAAAIILIAAPFIPHLLTLALQICGPYLLLGLAYYPRLHPLNLGRFGDFSYGTYLYAFPVQQLIVKFAGGSMAPIKLFMLSAPISLLFGVLSWFLVERHFLARSTVLKHEGKQLARTSD
jgi:peptidoglycan/LPS O-acetylase OafA/YrhL